MTAARSDQKLFALICLVLTLGTAALYWPITSHPFILYDDEQYVTANQHVTSGLSWPNTVWAFKNTEAANWHPLTWLSHQLDCTLFGLNAGRHHLVNLLFHVANTLLLFFFLRGTTGAIWRSASVVALFAWHPLHVESVAWVSERKDVLSTFFWLLTLLAYMRYAQRRSGGERREASVNNSPTLDARRSTLDYFLALFFFACGLMSKPMVVTLPFVLLLLDFWPLNRIRHPASGIRNLKILLVEKIPFFALAAAGSVVTYLAQAGAGAVSQASLMDRLANVAIAYTRYVAKTFWPSDLAVIYSQSKHWPPAMIVGAMLLLAAWTLLVLLRWRRSPALAFGWFWFLGTLVPTIGLVQVGATSMADRYTYIPGIGLFIALVWGAAEFFATRPRGRFILPLLGGGALLGCVLMTAIQISFWRDSVSLFRHAFEVTKDNYVANNLLGKAFEKAGDDQRALVLYRESVRIEPRFPQSRFNLAMTLLKFGDTNDALPHLEAAATMEKQDPDIQFALGIYFARYGSWTNAANCFSNAVAARPGFVEAKRELAKLPAAHPEPR